MKKKTVKKIATGFLSGKWWSGAKEPYFWRTTTNGEGYLVTEASLPLAVRQYLIRETVNRGYSWLDSPVVIDREWMEG